MENHKHTNEKGFCTICEKEGIKSIPIDMSKINFKCSTPTKERNFERISSLLHYYDDAKPEDFDYIDISTTVDLVTGEQGFVIKFKYTKKEK